jgi:DNA-binding transcriptional MocR family regulator
MAEALYRQIAEDLKNQIETGELAPGAQLPTEPSSLQTSFYPIEFVTRGAVIAETVRNMTGMPVNSP